MTTLGIPSSPTCVALKVSTITLLFSIRTRHASPVFFSASRQLSSSWSSSYVQSDAVGPPHLSATAVIVCPFVCPYCLPWRHFTSQFKSSRVPEPPLAQAPLVPRHLCDETTRQSLKAFSFSSSICRAVCMLQQSAVVQPASRQKGRDCL